MNDFVEFTRLYENETYLQARGVVPSRISRTEHSQEVLPGENAVLPRDNNAVLNEKIVLHRDNSDLPGGIKLPLGNIILSLEDAVLFEVDTKDYIKLSGDQVSLSYKSQDTLLIRERGGVILSLLPERKLKDANLLVGEETLIQNLTGVGDIHIFP